MGKIFDAVGQAVKDKWNGEHRCAMNPCNELSMGSPVRTMGSWMHFCSKHKVVGGGSKPVNVLAEAERKAAAEQRRAARAADKPPSKKRKKSSADEAPPKKPDKPVHSFVGDGT